MKKLVFTIICLWQTSCAFRQDVHIFNQGYAPEEIGKVVRVLDELGFDARPNNLNIPEEISRTSIIYPPIVQNFATIDTVRNSLSEIGFPNIELIYKTQGEHYYSTENIGLYLVNPSYNQPDDKNSSEESNSGPQISRIYYSDCGNIEAELNLFPQGAAILEIYEWNERTKREQTQQIDGEWSISQSQVIIDLFDGRSIVFGFREFSGRDDYGRYYGIQLENANNSTDITSCDFRYITYDFGESIIRR